MKRKSRVCIVTTVKDPGPSFENFLRYHLKTGFERIYIFFDDPKDSAVAVAKKIKNVKVILCDSKYQSKLKSLRTYRRVGTFLKTEVMARQVLNAEVAMGMAAKDGFDWIFHLDADELVYNQLEVNIGNFMAALPNDVEIMTCLNHEVVPESMDIHDPFSEVTLFKKNFSHSAMTKPQIRTLKKYFIDLGRPHFFAYPNGKSAARVRPHILPRTVHAFRSVNKDGDFEENPNVVSGYSSELVVYHYPNCGFDQYLTKYSVLGKFKDKWFKNITMPDFHMQSRDAFSHFDFRRLKTLYQQNVQFSDEEAIKILLKVGLFERNKFMSNLIKKK